VGRIRCFGHWYADFGDPIDWHLNPASGQRWDPGMHWTAVLADTGRHGDVKLTWEVGRFPQAYELARSAAFGLVDGRIAADVLRSQISDFVETNPYGRGIHWSSSQELVIRLVAWLFAIAVLREEPSILEAMPLVVRHLYEGAVHIERYFQYARKAVNNNHLISEAFGLYLAGTLLRELPQASRWADLGMVVLSEEADRQVYKDGAYLMHSHNYQRAAMQTYLLAIGLQERMGAKVPEAWRSAIGRSLEFLVAHQNPSDGRLPNYGSNDGSLPAVLSTCDYTDYRPHLQALSLVARGQRLYPPGPWDEEAAWLLGPPRLAAPIRVPRWESTSFADTGFHVLRGHDPASLACFRCGSIRHRFTQIDMLHLDVFWRGENVLVDGGTYLYNGPPEWHRHFTGGASHNTVTVDGRDQMLHHRRFKLLHLTKARLLRFEDAGAFAVAEGEHYGFRRHPGGCVHRRAVLHAKDDLWVVVDRLEGAGRHAARLHWLAGPYRHCYDADAGRLTLDTPKGAFTVTVLDGSGRPLAGDAVRGQERPPRGWYSRYYGDKVPVPSLAVTQVTDTPIEFVTLLGKGVPRYRVQDGAWQVEAEERGVRFSLSSGRFTRIEAQRKEGLAE